MKLTAICPVTLAPAWFAIVLAQAARVDPGNIERLVNSNQGSVPASQVRPVGPRIGARTAGDSGALALGPFGIWNEARQTP
jgi:hypothetical protein